MSDPLHHDRRQRGTVQFNVSASAARAARRNGGLWRRCGEHV